MRTKKGSMNANPTCFPRLSLLSKNDNLVILSRNLQNGRVALFPGDSLSRSLGDADQNSPRVLSLSPDTGDGQNEGQ